MSLSVPNNNAQPTVTYSITGPHRVDHRTQPERVDQAVDVHAAARRFQRHVEAWKGHTAGSMAVATRSVRAEATTTRLPRERLDPDWSASAVPQAMELRDVDALILPQAMELRDVDALILPGTS
jgi:hypothetical protein